MLKTVKGKPNLAKDSRSNSVINTDTREYNAAKERKKRIIADRKDLSNIKSQVSELETKINKLNENLELVLKVLNGKP